MRQKRLRHIEQKKISKECWNLDGAFIAWLKPRLETYLRESDKVINLEYHKFNYNGEELTQKQMIVKMIDMLDELMSDDLDTSLFWKDPEKWEKELQELGRIWAEVLPAMWW